MGYTIGFLGGGNMATGILEGLLASETLPAEKIYVKEIIKERAELLQDKYKITLVDSYAELNEKSDIIVLAVRPQDVPAVGAELSKVISNGKILVSICAGIQMEKLAGIIGWDVKYARIMPNTMIESKRGYSALAFAQGFNDDDRAEVQKITDAIGKTLFISENQFDAFTANSCAGPEWLILFSNALIDAAVESGLSRSDAKAIVYENMVATGTVLAETKKHPTQITDEMNTPGGIGIAGFHSFAKAGLHGIVMDGVRAAYIRTTELG